VRQRLVADVPVGAFLSGGLDSSTVVHFMRQFATGPLKTFSVRFAEKSYDEGDYAWEMARLLMGNRRSSGPAHQSGFQAW